MKKWILIETVADIWSFWSFGISKQKPAVCVQRNDAHKAESTKKYNRRGKNALPYMLYTFPVWQRIHPAYTDANMYYLG